MSRYGKKESKRMPQIVPYPSDIDFISGLVLGGGITAGAAGIGTAAGYGIGSLIGYLTK